MVEPEVLYDKLVSMTCQEIRDYCVDQGVKGQTQAESHCVLAELFKQNTTVHHISVGSRLCWAYDADEVELDETQDSGVQLAHSREMTTEMRTFIQRFDGEEFPELVIPVESYY